ncbi:MAG TPA: hypothetical protein VFE62_18500 [Gemmataceae bacterium]|nr:hypothetical protein [Gemmataceae bacterium]
MNLPYAFAWLPGLVFLVVVGTVYFLLRPAPHLAQAPAENSEVAPVATQKPRDQRGMHRRQGNPVEVHVGTPEDKKNTTLGSVLDRSVGGVRLAVFSDTEVGTVLSIKPVHADAMVPWVDIEVRSCRRSVEMPDHFEVGCQYVKSPPYSIQLLFG